MLQSSPQDEGCNLLLLVLCESAKYSLAKSDDIHENYKFGSFWLRKVGEVNFLKSLTKIVFFVS